MIRPLGRLLFAGASLLAITAWGLSALLGFIVAVFVGTWLAVDYLGLEL